MSERSLATRYASGGSSARFAAIVAGNVLLGVSVGLLAHYALTDLVNRWEQGALGTRMAEVVRDRPAGGLAAPGEAVTPSMELSGWEDEDATYWAAAAEGDPFGRLVITRMGLDCVVVKGAAPKDLKRGPGWIPGTDAPGGTGNVGIAGHRTTYGSPFGRIDELREGDIIDLYSPYRRYTYRVTGSQVVTPREVQVIAHTEEPRLTLTACHPRFSARYRYVVSARLVRVRRLPGEARALD